MLPLSKGMKGDELPWCCCGTSCHQRGSVDVISSVIVVLLIIHRD
jgi:hypothetical protein